MSSVDQDLDYETTNPNYSASSEDITAGLKSLRLPSRVSSNNSSRNPSIKSPELVQTGTPSPGSSSNHLEPQPHKSTLQELLSYTGDESFDWADDMPDFNSTTTEEEWSFDHHLERSSHRHGQVDTNHILDNPKVRSHEKSNKFVVGANCKDSKQDHKKHHDRKNKHHKDSYHSEGLSSQAMRLMPVEGWKPSPKNKENVSEEQKPHSKHHRKSNSRTGRKMPHLETPPSSSDSQLLSKHAVSSKHTSDVSHEDIEKKPKQYAKPVAKQDTKLDVKPDAKKDVKPAAEVIRIRYTGDNQKDDKPKKTVIKSKWSN